MGTLTLTDFEDEVWFLLERHTDANPTVPANEARLDRWINQAYLHIALPTTFKHPELQSSQTITLVTSTQFYALSATRWGVDHIRYTTRNRNLKRVSKEYLDRLNTTTIGEPSYWSRWGNTVYLNKTPGSSENGQTLLAFTWDIPTALTGTNATVLRAVFDEPMCHLAAGIGWARLGDMPRSEVHMTHYAAKINDLRSLDSVEGMQDSVGITLEQLGESYQ